MRLAIILATTLILGAACSELPGEIPRATAMIDGPAAPAPPGWIDYCRRHPEDAGCRP